MKDQIKFESISNDEAIRKEKRRLNDYKTTIKEIKEDYINKNISIELKKSLIRALKKRIKARKQIIKEYYWEDQLSDRLTKSKEE